MLSAGPDPIRARVLSRRRFWLRRVSGQARLAGAGAAGFGAGASGIGARTSWVAGHPGEKRARLLRLAAGTQVRVLGSTEAESSTSQPEAPRRAVTT